MKKVLNLSVILAVLATAFMFGSCSDEEGDAPQFSDMMIGETGISGKITCDNDLKTATLEKNGTTVPGYGFPISKFDVGQPISGKDGSYNIMIGGLTDGDYILIVTDSKDKKASYPFTIGGGENPNPDPDGDTALDSATDFSWIRDKGAAATGSLGTYGLSWPSNTATEAVIKPISGYTLVELSASQWTSITTKEALKEAVDGKTGIAEYKIAIKETADFNVVLATKNGDTYYMIHVTRVENYNYAGTTNYKYTISGQAKK